MKTTLLVVLALTLTLGCSKKSAEKTDTKDKAPVAMNTKMEAPGPVGMAPKKEVAMKSAPAVKEAAKGGAVPGTVSTKNGWVVITTPEGAGWECVNKTASRGATVASMVKCRRKDASEFLFLMAKDYTVSAKMVLPPKKLATEIFPKHYKRLFATQKIVKDGPVKRGKATGHEITLEATHKVKGAILKVEQVFVKGVHNIVLSVEGDPAMVKKFKKESDAFFKSARFKNLL